VGALAAAALQLDRTLHDAGEEAAAGAAAVVAAALARGALSRRHAACGRREGRTMELMKMKTVFI